MTIRLRKWNRPILQGLIILSTMIIAPAAAHADNLYNPGVTPTLTNDLKASQPGDLLSVIIIQNAEARNSAQNIMSRSSDMNASATGTDFGESFDLDLGRRYRGTGEVRRAESFATVMSATVTAVYPNGDLEIVGSQYLQINDEITEVDVQGRIRSVDINPDNTVLSSRIANARIRYDGEGFVTRSARPGLVTRVFNALGLF